VPAIVATPPKTRAGGRLSDQTEKAVAGVAAIALNPAFA